MKTKTTKVLVLCLCAILLVTGTVMATLAYLKSEDSVENTFASVGQVSITLDEAKVDEYGTAIENANRVKANSYKLIPGHEYKKDPTVHFAAGSEESYLFVKVTNGISAIEADTKINAQITANGWTALTGVDGVYYKKVDANTTTSAIDYIVFSTFKISGEADVDAYKDAKITVNAYAIQADGFNTAIAAWNAGSFE